MEIKDFSIDELKIICAALRAYYKQQSDAVGFFEGRLSLAGSQALRDELSQTSNLFDKVWSIISEEAYGED